jgi:transmembrane sensor
MKSRQPKDARTASNDSHIASEAIEWLVRLQDADFDPEEPYPDPLERRQAFVEWLKLSPAHVRAFMEIMEVERRVRHPDQQRHIEIEELLDCDPQTVIPISERAPSPRQAALPVDEHMPRQRRLSSLKQRRWFLTATAVAAGLAAVAVGVVLIPRPVTTSSAYYSTAIGERQVITLDDGSTVTLNTASRVAITYDRHTRQVRLLAGEALFNVRHNADRPFRVIADDVFLEDLGTQFDVYRRSSGTRVSVIKGRVQVVCGCVIGGDPSPSAAKPSAGAHFAPAHPSAVVILGSGEQADIDLSDTTATLNQRKLSAKEMARAIAWRDDHLWFSGEPLSAVVQEFNRYTPQRFVIADPAIANYKVGGMYLTSDAESFVKSLGDVFGIEVLPPDPADPTAIRLGRNALVVVDREE